jgi:hypothetical protein
VTLARLMIAFVACFALEGRCPLDVAAEASAA